MSSHKYVSNGDHKANPSSQETQSAGSSQAMRLACGITIFLVGRWCPLISLKLWATQHFNWHLHTVVDGIKHSIKFTKRNHRCSARLRRQHTMHAS